MHAGAARTRLTLAGAAVLLSVVGCGDPGAERPAAGGSTGASVRTPPATGANSPTSRPSASTPPGDPAHTVAAPGPFRPPLQTADILVFGQRPLSGAMVSRIRHLDGVTAVVRFSLAQVSVQDHAINVAAVDPATYRVFNPERIARFQQEWDRVAGGEMALSPRFRRQVQRDGYVRMGARVDAARVHVGAFASQIPQVDAVVNQAWAHDLGMRPGNALLVSTGIHTPLSIRKPLQRIVGRQASVTRMDAAARYGLDTSVAQTAFLVGSAADAVGSFSYTVLGGGRIAPERSWVAQHISTETMPVLGPMTCNTAMFPQLRAALDAIVAQGLAGAIHPSQYGGCFVPRFIAGTTTLSNHAFGLAFDLNVPENLRGTRGRIDRRVVAIFQQWGFTWGGTWHWTDPMHFELNRVVHAR
jgi:hypothetical protein